jgi:hypothetical protein
MGPGSPETLPGRNASHLPISSHPAGEMRVLHERQRCALDLKLQHPVVQGKHAKCQRPETAS